MHGPTCIFWANLTPFSLQFKLASIPRIRQLRSVTCRTSDSMGHMSHNCHETGESTDAFGKDLKFEYAASDGPGPPAAVKRP
jgi:hypothetical protein